MFRYNATLGHKVNHSFEPNAEFVLFPVHPVLGTIMSLAALTDIHPADEVRKDNVNKTKTINDVIFLGLFFRRKAKKEVSCDSGVTIAVICFFTICYAF